MNPAVPTSAAAPLFVVISFEGPDLRSQAGGLGVRVTGLTETLAELGHEVHLFFFGDPARPGEERRGRLVLHRWGQWLSRAHPAGVYDGEDAKTDDLTRALPSYVVERLLLPAIRAGRVPVVLLEEWQTADCAIQISALLREHGVRERALIAWNANNAYSFERIDWPRLASAAIVTTVSRYMRAIIRARGLDALVVPNGIPQRLLQPVRAAQVGELRAALNGTPFFFKMARWGSDKGWVQALDAVKLLRERGRRTLFVARSGGPSGGDAALDRAAEYRALRTLAVERSDALPSRIAEAVATDADVLSLRFGVNEDLARRLFATADGVLANSVSEPFGLVGLEAMAAGGLLYTGGTGEDYAVSGRNAVVLETLDPAEIADRAEELGGAPEHVARIRRAARREARTFTWPQTVQHLFRRLDEQARRQRLTLRLATHAHGLRPLLGRLRPPRARIIATIAPAQAENRAAIGSA